MATLPEAVADLSGPLGEKFRRGDYLLWREGGMQTRSRTHGA